jgi:hypothetical protein
VTCTTACIQPSRTNAHCTTCHHTFGSVTGFDRHRRNGECIAPTALPMHKDRRGVWRYDGNPRSARRG